MEQPDRSPYTSAILLLVCIAIGLGVWLFISSPFSSTIASLTINTSSLNPAQKHNVALAARALNNVIIPANGDMSFNGIVGDRTLERGYLNAPSFLMGHTQNSIGGGLCLVSSALYQLALQGQLSITERHPHLNTIQTIPPGLDATVWYGQLDLKLHNPHNYAIQLYTRPSSSSLTLGLHGPIGLPKTPTRPIQRQITAHQGSQVHVTVWANQQRISSNWYRLAAR